MSKIFFFTWIICLISHWCIFRYYIQQFIHLCVSFRCQLITLLKKSFFSSYIIEGGGKEVWMIIVPKVLLFSFVGYKTWIFSNINFNLQKRLFCLLSLKMYINISSIVLFLKITNRFPFYHLQTKSFIYSKKELYKKILVVCFFDFIILKLHLILTFILKAKMLYF